MQCKPYPIPPPKVDSRHHSLNPISSLNKCWFDMEFETLGFNMVCRFDIFDINILI